MQDGEQIRSTVAGPGMTEANAETWYQLATTDKRVLVVKLQKNDVGNYQPMLRMAASKSTVQISRFSASAMGSARIEIDGLEEQIVLVDIERPDIFPLIEPFIVSWGGRLGGDGTQRPSIPVPPVSGVNEKKLLLLAAGLFGVTVFFCGCAGILGGILAYTEASP